MLSKVLAVAALALGSFVFTLPSAHACGFKLALQGPNVDNLTTHRVENPGRILVYKEATSARLLRALKKVGHQVEMVTSKEGLDKAIASKRYDIVIADMSNLQDLPSSGSVVVVVAPTEEKKAEAKRHRFVIEGWSRSLSPNLKQVQMALTAAAGPAV